MTEVLQKHDLEMTSIKEEYLKDKDSIIQDHTLKLNVILIFFLNQLEFSYYSVSFLNKHTWTILEENRKV